MRLNRFALLLFAVAVAAITAGVACGAGVTDEHHDRNLSAARSRAVLHREYVVTDDQITVYDIDHGNKLVRTLPLPNLGPTHGAVVSPTTARLYLSYGGSGGSAGNGSLLAYNLLTDRVIWRRNYPMGIDSMAITPNGRTIYMPTGETAGTANRWRLIDATTGKLTGVSIKAGFAPHNTIMGPDGKYVYLGGCNTPFLEVASTATNRVVRTIGPLHGPGVRPFTINGSQTLAFTVSRDFLGFQVSSIKTGKVLYSVAPKGFLFDAATSGGRTPDHGISLSPDERELYLIDTANGYVHIFDVSGLPASKPHDIADIKMAHPPRHDGWLQHSRDGRYVYVGRAGDVIDTKRRKIVAFLPALQQTADFLEIDWQHGRPVSTTSRYGVGYRRR
jgi:DNA-binding beta-propeller fold protein YncE